MVKWVKWLKIGQFNLSFVLQSPSDRCNVARRLHHPAGSIVEDPPGHQNYPGQHGWRVSGPGGTPTGGGSRAEPSQ